MPAFPPFDPGRLDDDALRQPVLVRARLTEAVQAIKLRDAEIDRLGRAGADQTARLQQAERTLQERALEAEALRRELALQSDRVRDLAGQLEQAGTRLPRIGVQELVGQFRSQIERANADVLAQPGRGLLVDSVEVEVRGGLDVDGGLHLTQLPASALGAQGVSTLRFNLRPAATVRVVDDTP